ncbi:hypothetical protein [Actinomadura parmotrematis]|uniref:Transposase n=1 Tax=Actinomadura parmotrematis TaxID=2864039 RepID=A0ABS7G0Q8_9ACTN|nr:hypothetical protein [Actinomadura parmotrematis]MBW8486304.1 hypothetical protein [Actinomadura parmotrematis]
MSGCLLEPASATVVVRRRLARSGLCWERPLDQERRRRHSAYNSRYPRVGRT